MNPLASEHRPARVSIEDRQSLWPEHQNVVTQALRQKLVPALPAYRVYYAHQEPILLALNAEDSLVVITNGDEPTPPVWTTLFMNKDALAEAHFIVEHGFIPLALWPDRQHTLTLLFKEHVQGRIPLQQRTPDGSIRNVALGHDFERDCLYIEDVDKQRTFVETPQRKPILGQLGWDSLYIHTDAWNTAADFLPTALARVEARNRPPEPEVDFTETCIRVVYGNTHTLRYATQRELLTTIRITYKGELVEVEVVNDQVMLVTKHGKLRLSPVILRTPERPENVVTSRDLTILGPSHDALMRLYYHVMNPFDRFPFTLDFSETRAEEVGEKERKEAIKGIDHALNIVCKHLADRSMKNSYKLEEVEGTGLTICNASFYHHCNRNAKPPITSSNELLAAWNFLLSYYARKPTADTETGNSYTMTQDIAIPDVHLKNRKWKIAFVNLLDAILLREPQYDVSELENFLKNDNGRINLLIKIERQISKGSTKHARKKQAWQFGQLINYRFTFTLVPY